jgi:CheY-like chemotaxis protein
MLEGHLSPGARGLRDRINDAVELGVSLIERLLAFARKQHLTPQETDISAIAQGMEDLLAMALPETVTLAITHEDGPMLARIDPGQLESAILNLCVNAGQAIDAQGHIEIGVSKLPDGRISLSVRDNGCGMDADTLRQAAEPFFSARADGEGTGLGLSMVHGFIHQSGGSIGIESMPGIGTCITLLFPALTCSRTRSGDRGREQGGGRGGDRGREQGGDRSAMVVDDDPVSANAIAAMLEKRGYAVTCLTRFSQAQARLEQQDAPDLLVTDVQLDNGNSGWVLARQALDGFSECRVIAVSGHLPGQDPIGDGYGPRFVKLSKPVTEEMLAHHDGGGSSRPS